MHSDNFTLENEDYITEIESLVHVWKHDETQAKVISFLNSDPDKVFGITLKTPPDNSCGISHILEHMVLCGSKKYDIKRPFAEMLKGSMNTYLNAVTYPDRTTFIAASTNLKDLCNIKDVYLDAVFHPLLRKEVFMQEGWHVALSELEQPVLNGVVYNEMKGAFSSPEHTLSCYSFRSLFPDTIYRHESGGLPAEIPLVTYGDLLEFHRLHYHPSNAFFYFWGDDPEKARLEHLGKVINGYSFMQSNSVDILQPQFLSPISIDRTFDDSYGEGKGLISWNWMLGDVNNFGAYIGLKALELMLIGLPASPLYKVLAFSGFGEGSVSNGIMDDARQWAFSVGMRGVFPADFSKVDKLVIDTLKQMSERPIHKDLIHAATNITEFGLRENNYGFIPFGISVMQKVLTRWVYGEDPLLMLHVDAALEEFKKEVSAGDEYWKNLIDKYLINNMNHTKLTLTPRKCDNNNSELLNKSIIFDDDDASKLNLYHSSPDLPEQLIKIPRLTIMDVKQGSKIFNTQIIEGAAPILLYEAPTHGICYIELALDLSAVPLELFSYIPLLARFVFAMDPLGYADGDFNLKVISKAGGIDSSPLILTNYKSKKPVSKLLLTIKTTYKNVHDLLELIRDGLLKPNFKNYDVIKSTIIEELSILEQSIFFSGDEIIPSRLGSRYNKSYFLQEAIDGIEYFLFLKKIRHKIESDFEFFINDLCKLNDIIVNKNGISCNIACERNVSELMVKHIEQLIDQLPSKDVIESEIENIRLIQAPFEMVVVPAEVNAVGMAADMHRAKYSSHGSELVIIKHLQSSWLWDEIRVKGGAYRSSCSLDPVSGVMLMFSERDPRDRQTLNTFINSSDYLMRLSLTTSELEAAVVGVIADIDRHLLPDSRCHAEFINFLTGQTWEARQQIREEVLRTSLKDFRLFAEKLSIALTQPSGIVVGNDAVARRLATAPDWLITNLL